MFACLIAVAAAMKMSYVCYISDTYKYGTLCDTMKAAMEEYGGNVQGVTMEYLNMGPGNATEVMKSIGNSDAASIYLYQNMDLHLDNIEKMVMLSFCSLSDFSQYYGSMSSNDPSERKAATEAFIKDATRKSRMDPVDVVKEMRIKAQAKEQSTGKAKMLADYYVYIYGSGDYSSRVMWLLFVGAYVKVYDYVSVGSYYLCYGSYFDSELSRMKLHADYLMTDLDTLPSYSSYTAAKFNCTNIGVFHVSTTYNEKWGIEVADDGWWIRKYYSSTSSSSYSYSKYVSGTSSTGFMSFSWLYLDMAMWGQSISGDIRFVFTYTDTTGTMLKRKLNVSMTNGNLEYDDVYTDLYGGKMLSDSGITMTAEFDSSLGDWNELPDDVKLDLILLADNTDAISIDGDTPAGVAITKAKVGTTGDDTGEDDDGGLSGGAIAGIVIAIIVVAAVVAVGVFFFIKRRNDEDAGSQSDEDSVEGASRVDKGKTTENGSDHDHKGKREDRQCEQKEKVDEKKRKHKHKHKHKHRHCRHADDVKVKEAQNSKRHERKVSSSSCDSRSSSSSSGD